MPANLEDSEEATGLKKVSFYFSPKEGQCQRMFKLLHNCSHFTCYQILQARLQQYVNHELPDVQAGFRKGRGMRDKISNIHWIIKKVREFQKKKKKSTSASLTMWKSLTVWITTNWKILKEMGIPDYFTGHLRNLYACQESTVRTGHETTDWLQIGKGVCRGCILLPYSFK